VVFFLGGCTYTEIAALRWVGKQNKGMHLDIIDVHVNLTATPGRKILIATTGGMSGASMIESIAGMGKSTTGEASI
jgi:vacuolar protein sorting-associated protein 33A